MSNEQYGTVESVLAAQEAIDRFRAESSAIVDRFHAQYGAELTYAQFREMVNEIEALKRKSIQL